LLGRVTFQPPPITKTKKMLQPIINNSYLVEVNLTTVANGQRYYFLDVPTLRAPYVFIQGIESYTDKEVALSPNNAPIITPAGGTGLIVTLAVRETEEIYQMPYYTLYSSYNSGLIREFANKQINLTKSYVTILDATNLTAAQSCIFNFYYTIAK